MKNLLSILCSMMLLFTVSSCRKDDNDSPSQNTITGTWKAEKIVINGSISVPGIPPVPISQEKSNDCIKQSTLMLNADDTGHVVLKDDTSGACNEIMNEDFSYTYNQADNSMVITDASISENVTVESLTSNTLVLKRQFNNQAFPQGSFTGSLTVYYKK